MKAAHETDRDRIEPWTLTSGQREELDRLQAAEVLTDFERLRLVCFEDLTAIEGEAWERSSE